MESHKFTAVVLQFPDSPLWGWHFLVPNDIATSLVNGKDRRVICTLDERLVLHAALMPNKDTWFIMLNKANVKKLNLPPNGEINVLLIKDESEYGMPMADEFREVLDQDAMANDYFHALTPGKQRTLLYLVNSVKNVDSRIRKSLAIADHLMANKGAINFKMLNEAFKEYNKM